MDSQNEHKFYLFLLIASAAVLCFFGLETSGLTSGDETRVAGISAEMYLEGNYIVPKLNDKPFLEYPGLFYYFQSFCYHIFGINAFAAKLPSAIAAFASGILLFFFGRRLNFTPRAAFLSSIFLLTGAQFWANAHIGMVDSLLAFFVLLAVFGFHRFIEGKNTWGLLCYTLGIAGGIMTKGMIGFILPTAVLGSYLVGRDILEKKFRILPYLCLGTGILAGFLPWGVWAVLLYQAEGWNAFHTVFWVNNFGRFLGSQGDHLEPFYYYLEKLPGLFQPWLILLPFAVWHAVGNIRREKAKNSLFLLCAIVTPFLLLMFSSSKRQVYLLPLYAFPALLCGTWVDFCCSVEMFRKCLNYLQLILLVLLPIAGLGLCFFATPQTLVYPLLPLFFITPAILVFKTGKARFTLLVFGFVSFYTALYATVLEQHNKKSCLKEMFQFVREKEAEGYRTFLVSKSERTDGAAYFYLKKNIPNKLADKREIGQKELWIIRKRKGKFAHAFADSHFVVTPAEYYKKVPQKAEGRNTP